MLSNGSGQQRAYSAERGLVGALDGCGVAQPRPLGQKPC